MDFIGYVLYICFFIPMLMSLFVIEKNARLVVGYILVGATTCLIVSEFNGIVFSMLHKDMFFFCTSVSPINEEIIKALPILFFAYFFSNNMTKIVQASFAVGLGFAILENMIILVQNIDQLSISWSIIRGFGAGLMHSVCTIMVGIGISFVKKKRKLFICGTSALLIMAITYHAIYNAIVMSDYKYYGFVLPFMTYMPILRLYMKGKSIEASKNL